MRNIYQEINQSKATRQKESYTWKHIALLLFTVAVFCIVP